MLQVDKLRHLLSLEMLCGLLPVLYLMSVFISTNRYGERHE